MGLFFSPPLPNSYWVAGGRVAAGEYPGAPGESEARTKLERMLDHGVRSFVDLTTPADPLERYEPILASISGERGITVTYRRFEIRDLGIPTALQMTGILDHIDDEVESGRVIYVHCWGGVGRTGCVIGSYLVRNGWTGEDALATVGSLFATMTRGKLARHPAGSPEMPQQCAMVRTWSEQRAAAGANPRRFLPPSMQRRFRGCLLGGAVGDALGAPVEFQSLAQIRSHYGPNGITDFDSGPYPRGAITDDTQMTLFTAEGILRATHRLVDPRHTGIDADWRGVHSSNPSPTYHAYLRWLHTQGYSPPRGTEANKSPGWLVQIPGLHALRAPGNTCVSALRSGRQGSRQSPLNDSKGCGGVMRAAPAGLIETDDAFAYAAELAAITHGHPSGYLAAGALASIIRGVTRGASLDDAVHAALRRLAIEHAHEETTAALKAALDVFQQRVPVDAAIERLGKGWVAEEALAIAVYAALRANGDFETGARIAVNHGGDSDSTGAIAGNILGATLGVEAIPARWLDGLELRDEITALADDLLTGYRNGSVWFDRYPPD